MISPTRRQTRETVLMRTRSVAFDYRLGRHKEERMQKRPVTKLTEVQGKMDRCLSSLALAFAWHTGLADSASNLLHPRCHCCCCFLHCVLWTRQPVQQLMERQCIAPEIW